MTDCIFCQIVKRADPDVLLFQDERVTAFKDHTPRAPFHILIVPNRHFDSLNDLQVADEGLLGHMLLVAADMAREQGLSASGYRLVINTGPDAGQSVFHLHLHLLGGQPLPMTFGYGFNSPKA